ncbi:adenylate/guanylate cyclase domain-containing protein [Candidatus Woesearchaeota archaeon]|nr:adenylate/guanylate cyclase domain-containing protein [Candidatus Woesearchaeota archaeon]
MTGKLQTAIPLPKQLKQIKRTRLMTSLIIAVLVAALMSTVFSLGLYSNIQLRLSDFMYGGGTPLNNIAIVSVDDKSIHEIGRWPWDRGNYTLLLEQLDKAKVIGFDIGFFEPSDQATDTELAEAVARSGKVVMPVEYLSFKSEQGEVGGGEFLESIPEVKDAAAASGYINVVTDPDGITRAVNLNIKGEHEPFAYAVFRQYMKRPVEKKSRFLVNYIGKTGMYPTYSFSDIVNGRYGPDEFKDKIILVGATAPDLHDNYFVPTSYGQAMPGVEIHANTIQQFITGKNLNIAPDWLTILIIIAVSAGVALLVFYLPIWLGTAVSAAGLIAYTFTAISIFSTGWILNIIYVPATIVATYVATMIYFYQSEKKHRKKVLGAFEKYVSKDVIKHILENPDRLKLGGEKREITVFFSDIRGFTTISEKLTPEQLVALLNEYLTEMTNIILKHNGVVDKYMGDAIMAFWNAPLDQPKHAERACMTSLEMENRLKELQKKWSDDGVPPLEIGIGLNTGPAVVGNMGSYERFDYTAMGDTVNLGSRLEGLNKPYATRIIISQTTKKQIEGRPFLTRKLDLVAVKGKKEPIMIYELVSKKEDAKHWYSDVIRHFESGLDHYFKQKWEEAVKEFKEADKIREGGDPPSKAFIERCEHFRKHPPGKDWDGVWVMKTK